MEKEVFRKIHKYEVALNKVTSIHLPAGYKIAHVGSQDGRLFVWIDHQYLMPKTKAVNVHVIGTGWDIPDHIKMSEHIGTIQPQNSMFVWHLFAVEAK